MLKAKNILLGVSSSIACYKSAVLARELVRRGANVQVIMTQNATQFIAPLTFEQLTKHRCIVDTFDRNHEIRVEHVSLADWADAFVVAPADANVLAKFAHGLADDMLSTTMLACDCEKIVAPAMNTRMYENPAMQYNLAVLKTRNFCILEPEEGELACGTTGKGRMEEPERIVDYLEYLLGYGKDLKGKNILVTAGPTREAVDPVRFLTNHSTGKMGYALAKVAAARGAEVILVTGPTSLEKPSYVTCVDVVSAEEMYQAVTEHAAESDIVIMAAAVADYRPKTVADNKIKKQENDSVLELTRTKDILGTLGERKRPGQILCGFSMETEHMVENSRKKLEKKNLDMIVANNLKQVGAGFGTDTNVVTLITAQGDEELPLLSKEEVAEQILDRLAEMRQ
ncbi:MAG: bifunctional phosphopantothenoylcysteine decarboxylase/phosphopantothenate--cysteine ligase CoaBC [Lachnospiraceae bacterium]|nr:bifunctional phosphopantothenoylcysteine decarboxylase/phosphopantothenate--cysteine ligase CoaBC [Lachnospiraceae bacterium]